MEGENKMINVNEILHRLIAEFQSIEQVTAIAMAGSKFSNYQELLLNRESQQRQNLKHHLFEHGG